MKRATPRPTRRLRQGAAHGEGLPERSGEGDPGDEDRDAQDWTASGGQHSSHGLLQTLIGTAVAARPDLFAGVDPAKYREVLWRPENSIAAGVAYMAHFDASVLADPVALRFAYGAGSVRPSSSNRWGAVLYDEIVPLRFIAFWNDLACVLAGQCVAAPPPNPTPAPASRERMWLTLGLSLLAVSAAASAAAVLYTKRMEQHEPTELRDGRLPAHVGADRDLWPARRRPALRHADRRDADPRARARSSRGSSMTSGISSATPSATWGMRSATRVGDITWQARRSRDQSRGARRRQGRRRRGEVRGSRGGAPRPGAKRGGALDRPRGQRRGNFIGHNIVVFVQLVQVGVSFIPGIGEGLSAVIGAGLALAEGKSITDALIAAALSALPGGPLVAMAASIATEAITGAIEHKSFADIVGNVVADNIPAGGALAKAVVHGVAGVVGAATTGHNVGQALVSGVTSAVGSAASGADPDPRRDRERCRGRRGEGRQRRRKTFGQSVVNAAGQVVSGVASGKRLDQALAGAAAGRRRGGGRAIANSPAARAASSTRRREPRAKSSRGSRSTWSRSARRARSSRGDNARNAFDTAVALTHAKNVQQAGIKNPFRSFLERPEGREVLPRDARDRRGGPQGAAGDLLRRAP